jgi:hypothetical protein
MAFDPTDHDDTLSILTQVGYCISDIWTWMVENKHKPNDEKTEVIVLSSKAQKFRHNISKLLFGEVPVTTSVSVHWRTMRSDTTKG